MLHRQKAVIQKRYHRYAMAVVGTIISCRRSFTAIDCTDKIAIDCNRAIDCTTSGSQQEIIGIDNWELSCVRGGEVIDGM